MKLHNLFVHLLFICCLEKFDTFAERKCRHVDVVLIGATGNLAKKHLWKSLYNVHKSLDKHSGASPLTFYGSGRTEYVKGAQKLRRILENITESSENNVEVEYIQLKSEQDYKKFCAGLDLDKNQLYSSCGRLFYLAIPPKDYLLVANYISKHCRPRNGIWLRVAVEKPFGNNQLTSKDFLQQLQQFLSHSELYLIDHYMWKKTVREIIPFRYSNKKWLELIWSNDHIEKIEITLLEIEDVKERINFYDSVGVFADVLQNHLTQVLLNLLADCEKPSRSDTLLSDKLKLLEHFLPISETKAFIAQYDTYKNQLRRIVNSSEITSQTPTFAAVILESSHPRWIGIPIYLTSGKALDKKLSFIRIIFKSKNEVDSDGKIINSVEDVEQILFFINNNNNNHHNPFKHQPALLIHKQLVHSSDLVCDLVDQTYNHVYFLGINSSNYHMCSVLGEDDAYFHLLLAILQGNQSNFLSPELIVASWRPWSRPETEKEWKLHFYEANSSGPQLYYIPKIGWKIKKSVKNAAKDEL